MNIQETQKSSNNLLSILSYSIIAAGLLFAFIGLSEFYNIKILGNQSEYPFGPINENPWYYQNASIYASYNLTSGLMFLAAFSLTAWSKMKNNKRAAHLGICLTILFFLTELISSDIQ